MAALTDINATLIELVQAALMSAGYLSAQVSNEWPPKDALQDVGAGGPPIVSIYHRMTTYKTTGPRLQHSSATNDCGITAALSDFSLAPGQSVTLTISLAQGSSQVNLNDEIGCQFTNGDTNLSTIYKAPNGTTTVAQMATGIAAQINTNVPSITAVASGATVTITNNDAVGYHVSANVGNEMSINWAVKWAHRSMQINTWSGSLTDKFALQAAIEGLVAQLDDSVGFALPSGEWIEFHMMSAKPDDANTDKSIYTDYFLFTLIHMVDVTENYTSVVATGPQLTAE